MLAHRREEVPLKDRIIINLLGEFCREFEIESLAEDKQFEHFACYITVHRHYGRTFDTSEVLTGSAIGIDGIAILVNGVLIIDMDTLEQLAEQADYLEVVIVFVQADRAAGFDVGKLGTFSFAVKDFFEKDEPKLARNDEINEAAAIVAAIYDKYAGKLKRGNPICRLYYVTTGKVTGDQNLEARRKVAIDEIYSTELFHSVDVDLIGRDDAQKLYYQTKNAIARDFVWSQRVPVPEMAGVREAYIGLIAAPDFIGILTDDDGDMLRGIFDDNVRDWQDYNPVNVEIKSTLESPAKARFALMNNGITIIARTMRPTANKIRIEDFQVVNGCQTSHVLFEQRHSIDSSVMIPLRLIATEDEDIINSIIRATNRQTEVAEEQFFALTVFPKTLEEYFKTFPVPHRLYYERRSKQYDRLPIEKTRIVTQANLLKAFAAMFSGEPHAATRSKKALRGKMGTEIFARDHRLEPYYVAAYAAYLLEYRFRNNRIDAAYKAARFHILLAARMLADPVPLSQLNSREMGKYCDSLMATLWDGDQAEALFVRAVYAVDAAMRETVTDEKLSDIIRTLPFTQAVLKHCGLIVKALQS
jgi:hypothetical protein